MRADGGIILWICGVWGRGISWGSSGEVSCMARGGLGSSPDKFVWRGCVGCCGISLDGASGSGPVVFWVVWFTVGVVWLTTRGVEGG